MTVLSDRGEPPLWICPPPGAPQSLSPFESRTTTLVVLWSTLVLSTALLVICWTFLT